MSGFYKRPERPPWKHSHWHSTCRECLLKRKHARYHADVEESRATRLRQVQKQRERRAKVLVTGGTSRIAPREEMRRERDEKNRRTYQRALVRDGIPRVGLLSFSQRTMVRRIREGSERLLRSMGAEEISGDARAALAAAIWADMSLTMAERQRRLANLRRDD